MGLATSILKSFLASKLGSKGTDDLINDARLLRTKTLWKPLDAATLRTAIEALPALRAAAGNGLLVLREPSPTQPGLAYVFDPAIRANPAIMAELARHGTWELHDVS